MFNFFKKKKNNSVWHWRNECTYYYKDGVLYRVENEMYVDDNDRNLTRYEFFKKYGAGVCEYSLEVDDFAPWQIIYYETIDEFLTDGMEEVISEDHLNEVIQSLKVAFKKKFEDFPLDDTIYTKKYLDMYDTDGACFEPIATVVKKLINKKAENITEAYILEILVIDGLNAEAKRMFITFDDFLQEYENECNVAVLESNDYENSIEDYFLKI